MSICTAESVTKGHPDKVCDFISDSVLDACLAADSESRVACEVMASANKILVGGEITCKKIPDINRIVKTCIYECGYTPDGMDIIVDVHAQSPDIAQGLEKNAVIDKLAFGAGDQGIMYGYATNETKEMLPVPVVLAHKIAQRLTKVRETGEVDWLLPDGKAQVTLDRNKITGEIMVKTVVVSAQHKEHVIIEALREVLAREVVKPVLAENGIEYRNTQLLMNPAGRFVIGGYKGDTGLTGRKIMVDTYGGLHPHGGGAFSGKDCTKVDRSGAYMCRFIAKNIVDSNMADSALVSLGYAIGIAEPVMVSVYTFGTGVHRDEDIADMVRRAVDLRPMAIIDRLGLNKPIFSRICNYGHFMHQEAPWEKVGMINFESHRKRL